MHKIAVIPGDGIGPELTEATLHVLNAVQDRFSIGLDLNETEAGDECLKKRGVALPQETINAIETSDTCLKGPVGETAADVIVKLRLILDLYANIRPIRSYPNIPAIRPDIDFVFVRENTEDVYRGLEFTLDEGVTVALRLITRKACERIATHAFELARRERRSKVTSVHKANVLRLTDGLFAQVCRDVAKNYPEIALEELYVDAASMHLIRRPQEFQVILTTNLFGDILSDEAAQLVGGLGMAPGANIGDRFALFEPIHGSAPTIAGKQVANPISMILAAKMMLQWLGDRKGDGKCLEAAKAIEKAVKASLSENIMTPDLGGDTRTGDVGLWMAKHVRGCE
jgi:3-isopropylmalate dehydrogenase